MPTAPKIVLHVRRVTSPPPSDSTDDCVSEPLDPGEDGGGIPLGTASHAAFRCLNDPEVEASHGTLERTPTLGVWVYVDHSTKGSLLNGKQRIHRDAVVVHHGDRLRLGHTEIELRFEQSTSEAEPEVDEKETTSATDNQEEQRCDEKPAPSAVFGGPRRASSPWPSSFKLQLAKDRLPRIETSGLDFRQHVPPSTTQQMAAPPEYTASPIPGARWRKKRNSIATATLPSVRRSPSPPLEQHTQPPLAFHRPRTRLVPSTAVLSTPPRSYPAATAGKTARPPPLEYSSSPVGSPSAASAQQHHNLFQQPPAIQPSSATGFILGGVPPAPNGGVKPKSRRDDLRIQVSKKMAAAAPASVGSGQKPRVEPPVLSFPAPASPVAQKDILQQQKSLLTILQHKFEEEQVLKQQQEEWMRQFSTPPVSTEAPSPASPQSPSNTDKLQVHDRLNTPAFFPDQAPVLLRTISLGLAGQKNYLPSPRLKAAVQASRMRLNSFDDKSTAPSTPTEEVDADFDTLERSPNTRGGNRRQRSNQDKRGEELRVSDESVASSAPTIAACHRRVTRSLSISSGSASSVDLSDFLGYEEEEDAADVVTSYTTSGLYGSVELLRRSLEDAALLFDGNRDSIGSAASLSDSYSPPPSTFSGFSPPNPTTTAAFPVDLQLQSPRRQGSEPQESNQLRHLRDCPSHEASSTLGSRVCSPKSGQFDPQSPYKSSAALEQHRAQQLQHRRRSTLGPEDEAEDKEQQQREKPFRRPSFRLRAPPPLATTDG